MAAKRRPRPHLVPPPGPVEPRLHPDAKTWREQLTAEYDLLPHHVQIADLAAAELSRSMFARAALDEHGMTTVNRFGELRPRPEVAIARQSADAFRRLLRELLLDAPGSDRGMPRAGGA
jgi:hypothetical protein